MLFSERSIWTMVHGIGLGGGALLGLAAALFYLYAARPATLSGSQLTPGVHVLFFMSEESGRCTTRGAFGGLSQLRTGTAKDFLSHMMLLASGSCSWQGCSS